MITIAINERMTSSDSLTAIVGDKIFPIMLEDKTKAPAISFNAGDLPVKAKSGDAGDNHEAVIVVVSLSLAQLADINKEVKALFHNSAWKTPEFKYIRSSVESINRGYNQEFQEYSSTIRLTLNSKLN